MAYRSCENERVWENLNSTYKSEEILCKIFRKLLILQKNRR